MNAPDPAAATTPLPPHRGRLRRLRDLGGPRPWPLVGNTMQVRRERVHQDIEAWAKRYGPYFVMRFGRRDILVVCDHETTTRLLRERPDHFGRTQRLADVAQELRLKLGLFAAEGDAWREQRRMVMASFSPTHIRAYFPSMLNVTQRLERRWRQAGQADAWIDVPADLMRYTVDTITGLALGHDVNTLEATGDVIQRHLDTIFPGLSRRTFSLFPYWRFFKTRADRELEDSIREVDAAITRFIAEARQRLAQDPGRRHQPPNLLEAFIVAAEEGDGLVRDDNVAGNVLTMLLAGEDTTANTLAWLIHLLSRHPQVMERAREEVLSLASRTADFTPETMVRMDYLEACAHEAMRLKPVAPFLPAQALVDTTVADIEVPRGTIVWNVLRHDSVDERYFEHAQAFEPQRWLQQGGAGKSIAMPFGSGPRICPGRYLALLEIKLAMAMLLLNFDLRDVQAGDGGEVVEHMAFTMGPQSLRMRLGARG